MTIGSDEPLEGYSYWDNYPKHTVEDWMAEISNEHTRSGYWGWVRDRVEDTDEDTDEDQHEFEFVGAVSDS